MASRIRLDGRVALVTGGGRGIGRAVALALGAAGAVVAVTGRTRPRLEAVVRELDATGLGHAMAEELDVTDPEPLTAALARIEARLGPVSILVNNAGIAESAPLARTDPSLWRRHLEVNVTGPFLLTRAVLPGMLARRSGRIINIASTAGLAGAPYISAYAASKHALIGLTRALAAETTGTGVTVNAVCPGYVATEMTWESARRIAQRTGRAFDDAVATLARSNASGRLRTPEEVAQAVLALADDEAGDRSGETVVLE